MQVLEEFLVAAVATGDLCQPDGGFHSLDLAKERGYGLEVVMPPVVEKALGDWRDAPVRWVGNGPPTRDVSTNLIDDGGWVVFLVRGREALGIREHEAGLARLALLLPWLGDRRDEFRSPTTVYGWCVERLMVQAVEHVRRFAHRRRNDPCVKRSIVAGHTHVCREPRRGRYRIWR